MEAYDCLKRGLHHHRIGGVTRENAEEAMRWLEKALEKDPSFGRAQAWLACAVATRDEWIGVMDEDHYWAMGRRALELDSDDAEVHRIMGSLSLYKEDFDNALYHYTRALEITPNHAYSVTIFFKYKNDGAKRDQNFRHFRQFRHIRHFSLRHSKSNVHFIIHDVSKQSERMEKWQTTFLSRRSKLF